MNSITLFNENDGLPHHFIEDVAEDLEGNIWISTSGGVAIYDGTGITVKFDSVCGYDRIIVDLNGNVWFGEKHYGYRPYRFDGNQLERFTSYKPLCETLSEDKSYYYSRAYIYYYHMNRWDTIPIPYYEHENCGREDVLLDSKGNFWVTTNDYCLTGVYRYDGHQWVDYNTREIFSSEVGNSLYGVIENRNNEILISDGGHILKYANDQWSIFLDFSEKIGLLTFSLELYEDSKGNIWFGIIDACNYTGNLYNYNGKDVRLFDLSDYEKTGENDYRLINCICEDRYGNIWVGTSDGLFRISRL